MQHFPCKRLIAHILLITHLVTACAPPRNLQMLGSSPPANSITALSLQETPPVTKPAATTTAAPASPAPLPEPISLCRIRNAAAHPLALPAHSTLHFKEVHNNYVADLAGDGYTLKNIPVYFEGNEGASAPSTSKSIFTPQALIAATPTWQKAYIHLYPAPKEGQRQRLITSGQALQKPNFIYIGNPLKQTHFTTATGEVIQFTCTCSRAGLEALVYKQPKGGTGETSATMRLPVCFTEGSTLAKLATAPAHYAIEIHKINNKAVSPLAGCASAQEFLGEMKPSTAAYICVREERRQVSTPKLPAEVASCKDHGPLRLHQCTPNRYGMHYARCPYQTTPAAPAPQRPISTTSIAGSWTPNPPPMPDIESRAQPEVKATSSTQGTTQGNSVPLHRPRVTPQTPSTPPPPASLIEPFLLRYTQKLSESDRKQFTTTFVPLLRNRLAPADRILQAEIIAYFEQGGSFSQPILTDTPVVDWIKASLIEDLTHGYYADANELTTAVFLTKLQQLTHHYKGNRLEQLLLGIRTQQEKEALGVVALTDLVALLLPTEQHPLFDPSALALPQWWPTLRARYCQQQLSKLTLPFTTAEKEELKAVVAKSGWRPCTIDSLLHGLGGA